MRSRILGRIQPRPTGRWPTIFRLETMTMSEWIVVPNLLEGRDQLDERFPHREHGAEGTIGDQAHQGSASSHNPDETGKPEYSDHDSVNEVRAADFDKDLHDDHGVTMEQVVQ